MRYIALLFTVLALLPAFPAAAQSDTRCFPETGQCISGPIRAYWERNGGLPIFGYPITPLQQESVNDDEGRAVWMGPVQWFERDRLEDHSDEGLGVLAGRLGAEQLRQFSFQIALPRPGQTQGAAPGCRYFVETRHSLCAPYLQYWERNGGLMRFGYPISEPFTMTMGPWSGEVQYFERRRMERHTDMPGAPVLLGLLGREQHDRVPSATCAVPMDPVFGDSARETYGMLMFLAGCPVTAQRETPLAEQQFERGMMVWAGAFGGNRIFTIRGTPLPVTWTSYPDMWMSWEPETANLTPPPGLQEPKRGFGKVWREQPDVRQALGWAMGPERADKGVMQTYTNGAIIYMEGSNFVYMFGPNGLTWAFTRYP